MRVLTIPALARLLVLCFVGVQQGGLAAARRVLAREHDSPGHFLHRQVPDVSCRNTTQSLSANCGEEKLVATTNGQAKKDAGLRLVNKENWRTNRQGRAERDTHKPTNKRKTAICERDNQVKGLNWAFSGVDAELYQLGASACFR